jgi:hypothetical protein
MSSSAAADAAATAAAAAAAAATASAAATAELSAASLSWVLVLQEPTLVLDVIGVMTDDGVTGQRVMSNQGQHDALDDGWLVVSVSGITSPTAVYFISLKDPEQQVKVRPGHGTAQGECVHPCVVVKLADLSSGCATHLLSGPFGVGTVKAFLSCHALPQPSSLCTHSVLYQVWKWPIVGFDVVLDASADSEHHSWTRL